MQAKRGDGEARVRLRRDAGIERPESSALEDRPEVCRAPQTPGRQSWLVRRSAILRDGMGRLSVCARVRLDVALVMDAGRRGVESGHDFQMGFAVLAIEPRLDGQSAGLAPV